jgi:hypothetical protein
MFPWRLCFLFRLYSEINTSFKGITNSDFQKAFSSILGKKEALVETRAVYQN